VQDKCQPFALERLPRNCWIRAERLQSSGPGDKGVDRNEREKESPGTWKAPWDRQGKISLTFLTDLRELRAGDVKKGFIIMSAARTM
jgi:hypothetical protein